MGPEQTRAGSIWPRLMMAAQGLLVAALGLLVTAQGPLLAAELQQPVNY